MPPTASAIRGRTWIVPVGPGPRRPRSLDTRMPSKPRRTARRASGDGLDAAEDDRPVPGLADRRERRPALPGLRGRRARGGCTPRSRARPSRATSGSSPSGQSRANQREPFGAASGDGLDRRARLRRVHVGEPEGRRRAGGRGLAVGVREGLPPTGPRMIGAGIVTPSMVALRSRSARSMNIRGTIRHARSACAFARAAAAPPAAASRCRRAPSDSTFAAAASRSARFVVKIGLTPARHPGDVDLGLVAARTGRPGRRGAATARDGAERAPTAPRRARSARGRSRRRPCRRPRGTDGGWSRTSTAQRARVREERDRAR